MDIETLLRMLGEQERETLSDETIDAILEHAPQVTLSEGFRDRALKAMQEAQRKREAKK